jgi:uncharacterized protein YegP (UPF0339 family)
MEFHFEGGMLVKERRMDYTFEVFKGKNNKWFWRCRARNQEIVADGAQGYSTSQNCRRAAKRLVDSIRDGAFITVETVK